MDSVNFFFGSVSYWFWIGTLYLIFLTWQDYKRHPVTGLPMRLVDDRLNYFMMGSTFALLSHVRRPVWFTLGLVVIVVVMGYFLHRFKTVGDADIKTIGWIFYGTAIINLYQFVTFILIFLVSTAIYAGLKFGVFKYRKPTPFYGVILISFLTTALLWGSYLH
jgi:hypothetical protein